MLWLAVFLPDFIIDCCRQGTAPDGSPLGIFESDRLVAVNPVAAREGVQVGMAGATALALQPHIRLIQRNAARESSILHGIACWALQFTPQVSLHAPQVGDSRAGLLLDIGASLVLFGGVRRLLNRVRAGLAEQGLGAHLACAPTPAGAWMLARHRDGLQAEDLAQMSTLLARLPVRLIDAAQPHEEALQAIGVRTVGDLLQLPRAGLARRFSPALLHDIDRAIGQVPDPRTLFQAPTRFESSIELPAPVDDAERLLFAAKRLLLQLCGWLAGRQCGARRLSLIAEHERLSPTAVAFGPDQPSRDPNQLTILLSEALRRCQLPAATSSLRLHCQDIQEYAAPSGELFPGAIAAPEQLGRLVERLKARLGDEKIQQLHQVSEHRPERAWRIEPVQLGGKLGPAPRSTGAHRRALEHASPRSALIGPPGLRPLWLIDPPLALSERNNRPFWESPLSLLAGPERIESGWWDDSLVMRDYFIAEDSSHRLLWIFRERQPSSTSAWYLHGRFG